MATYVAYDNTLPVKIDPAGYIQNPVCNYAFTAAFTWTGTNDYIYVDPVVGG